MILNRRAVLAGGASVTALAACSPTQAPVADQKTDAAAPGQSTAAASTIPVFSVLATDGRTISNTDFTGKAVVFEWTNHDCPFVKRHYNAANMQSLMEAAKAQGVAWVQVISSAPGKQGYVDAATATALNTQRKAAPTMTLLDESGAMGLAFGAKTTPHMFVYAPTGAVLFAGAIDDAPSGDEAGVAKARNYVREALAALKEGRAPAVTSAPAYGCSIKYAA